MVSRRTPKKRKLVKASEVAPKRSKPAAVQSRYATGLSLGNTRTSLSFSFFLSPFFFELNHFHTSQFEHSEEEEEEEQDSLARKRRMSIQPVLIDPQPQAAEKLVELVPQENEKLSLLVMRGILGELAP